MKPSHVLHGIGVELYLALGAAKEEVMSHVLGVLRRLGSDTHPTHGVFERIHLIGSPRLLMIRTVVSDVRRMVHASFPLKTHQGHYEPRTSYSAIALIDAGAAILGHQQNVIGIFASGIYRSVHTG